jgi:hypothetical protein
MTPVVYGATVDGSLWGVPPFPKILRPRCDGGHICAGGCLWFDMPARDGKREMAMALVQCPDCGTAVSNLAAACPKCARPINMAEVAPTPRRSVARETRPLAWIAAGALIIYLSYAAIKENHDAKLPPLPVNVEFRPALLGPGYVLRLQNTSDRPLQLMASLTHPAVNDTRKYDVLVPARSFTELSHFNGWITQHGDRIALENSNFKSWTGSIP